MRTRKRNPFMFISHSSDDNHIVNFVEIKKSVFQKNKSDHSSFSEDLNDYLFHFFDLKTFKRYKMEAKNLLNNNLCGFYENIGIIFFRPDGSLYAQSSPGQTIELFDPLNNFNFIDTNEDFLNRACTGGGDGTFMIKELNNFVIYDLKTRKRFMVPKKLISADLPVYLYFPYLIEHNHSDPKHKFYNLYHIPSAKLKVKEYSHPIKIDRDKSYALEIIGEGSKRKIQVISHPFDESKRKVLFEKDKKSICYYNFFSDRKALIHTKNGILFSVDLNTGSVNQNFIGSCLFLLMKNKKDTLFTKETIDPLPGSLWRSNKFQITTHLSNKQCIETLDTLPENTEELLYRFSSKSEDPAQDSFLPFLVTVLKEGTAIKKYPNLMRDVMGTLFLHYPHLFLNLYHAYPSLKDLPPLSLSIASDNETKLKLTGALRSFLNNYSHSFYRSNFSQLEIIRKLKPLLSLLSEEEVDSYIEKVTMSISNGLTTEIDLFKNVFQSKLYYVILNNVKKLFGRDYKPVSDITIARKNNNATTMILSSNPIYSAEGFPYFSTNFGLYYSIVPKASYNHEARLKEPKSLGTELIDETVEWSLKTDYSGNHHYRAKIKISTKEDVVYLKRENYIDKQSLNYEDVWMDEKMVGFMIIGSSLHSFSKILVENYFDYFKAEGFEFETKKVSHFKSFFLNGIANCEIDYFLKESHSDGDERHVLRFDSVNHILKGTRSRIDGRKEVIYLAFPKLFHLQKEKKKTELLSYKELSQALSQREKSKCGEITYFNTSCWSHVKARYEIEAVNSPLFINIPSVSISSTFLNEENDAIRSLIHSYRNELDFDGFRDNLEKNNYVSTKLNHYIFPDESYYQKKILKHISLPLNINIQLEKRRGDIWKTTNPDEIF